jgi:hypothetical protein
VLLFLHVALSLCTLVFNRPAWILREATLELIAALMRFGVAGLVLFSIDLSCADAPA